MTNMKKKLFISSLAGIMITTSTSFAMLPIHGEGETSEIVRTDETLNPLVNNKKALLKNDGTVMERNDDATNTTSTTSITDLSSIADLMIDDNVTEIPAEKFKDKKNLTKLTFKNGSTSSTVTKIGKHAFKNTGIVQVDFPKNLSVIDEGAFADTTALTTVSFANAKNLEHIKKGAFENSNLTSLDFTPLNTGTKQIFKIEENAFKGNKNLTTVTLSNKLRILANNTFASTNVKNIHFSQNIILVSPNAFEGTPLATITVDSNNRFYTAIENVLYMASTTYLYLFLYPEGRVQTEFTFPDTVTYIWPRAIHTPKYLKKLVIGQGLTSIEQDLFENATQLTTLDLRNALSLTRIGMNAFKDSALNSIIIGDKTGALTSIGQNAFKSSAAKKKISFLDDANQPYSGSKLTALVSKYTALQAAVQDWQFADKLPKPSATVDYTNMKLTGLEPSANYKIQNNIYTSDDTGKLDVLKAWGGNTITIIRNPGEADESHVQELPIEGIYTLTLDGVATLKKEGTTITVTAPEKSGHVFTTWAWSNEDETIPVSVGKRVTFAMPSKDIILTKEYTEIIVNTPTNDLVFDRTKDVVVTLTSPFPNFSNVAVNSKNLTKDEDYTVSGDKETTIMLKKRYLDSRTSPTTFVATFKEGGDISFTIRFYGLIPTAVANYTEMKLTGLAPNTAYKINDVVKTTGVEGTLPIEKAWSSTTLEIIKKATGNEMDSKSQSLPIAKLYSIRVNEKEVNFTTAGTKVKIKAEHKKDHRFKEWKTKRLTLADTKKEEITFEMPPYDVALEVIYEVVPHQDVLPEETLVLPETKPTLPTLYPKVEKTNTQITKAFVKSPKTGDTNNRWIVLTAMLTSLGTLIFAKIRKKTIH